MTAACVIGIPRYLGHYTFGPLWETFLTELGFEVALSPRSNNSILDDGVRETVNDACIPIKLFHGHVMALKDRVDILFIPRMVSADGVSTFCPKFLGLPDMVRHSISGLPDILSPRLHLGRGGRKLKGFLHGVGRDLAAGGARVSRACRRAVRTFDDHRRRLVSEGIGVMGLAGPAVEKLRLGVVGYPYVLYDSLSNAGLISRLLRFGAAVETPDTVPEAELRRQQRALPMSTFWHYSNRALWAGLHFLHRPDIDGVIHVTAFGCGPDAMVDKVLELEFKDHRRPFMSMTVDEHTGEAGVDTRAEAFVDMILRRGGRVR